MHEDFNSKSAQDAWRPVNDGVMGGRSSGGPEFQNGVMVFKGTINTNGGGFSSVRTSLNPGQLTDSRGIKLRVKQDGRQYKLTLRTNATYGWRPISFQAAIPKTPMDEWAEVTVPYADLSASIFGRTVRGATFDKAEVREIGIIISDGIDGPFHLEVDWITTCET